jgi:hypothetical protein
VSFYNIYKIDRRVSRLRNFLLTGLLTGILPYTGFAFDLPEHQSYILYIIFYYALSIYISPITYIQAHRRAPCPTRTSCHYFITALYTSPGHQSYIYIIFYYTVRVTALKIRRSSVFCNPASLLYNSPIQDQ